MARPSKLDQQIENLALLLKSVLNDSVLTDRMRGNLVPKIRNLHRSKQHLNQINATLVRISTQLGDTHPIWISGLDEERKYDNFGSSLLHEIVIAYHRTRNQITRMHLDYVAIQTIREHPDWIKGFDDQARKVHIPILVDRIWSELEFCYFRLSGYWDRVAQFLEFIYFNSRNFERLGIVTVLDKIQDNYFQFYPEIEGNTKYQKIRKYIHQSEKKGLKWVISRRNLITHNMHLSERMLMKSGQLDYYSNHHEAKYDKRLKKGTLKEEFEAVHFHYSKIVDLFEDFLWLFETGNNMGFHHTLPKRKRTKRRIA